MGRQKISPSVRLVPGIHEKQIFGGKIEPLQVLNQGSRIMISFRRPNDGDSVRVEESLEAPQGFAWHHDGQSTLRNF